MLRGPLGVDQVIAKRMGDGDSRVLPRRGNGRKAPGELRHGSVGEKTPRALLGVQKALIDLGADSRRQEHLAGRRRALHGERLGHRRSGDDEFLVEATSSKEGDLSGMCPDRTADPQPAYGGLDLPQLAGRPTKGPGGSRGPPGVVIPVEHEQEGITAELEQ